MSSSSCPKPRASLLEYMPSLIEKDFTLEEKKFIRFQHSLCKVEREPQYMPVGTWRKRDLDEYSLWRKRDRLREMERSLNEEKI